MSTMVKISTKFQFKLLLFCVNMTILAHAEHVHSHLPLHRRMDPELLKQTFNVESYEKVPDYEMVYVRTLSKRSVADESGETRHVHLSAFGRDIHLHLQRNDEFDDRLKTMKMYFAESINNSIQYREIPPGDDDSCTAYHDLAQMAAVTIGHGEKGEIRMDGTIGNDLVLKPVPTSILVHEDGFVDDEMFLDEEESYETSRNNRNNTFSRFMKSPQTPRGGAHFVYRGPVISNNSYSDFLPLDDVRGHFNGNQAVNRSGFTIGRRNKRSLNPSSAWAEVLVLVDYDSFVVHGRSNVQVKKYLASFWNAVDLRYKLLTNPKIRISLAEIFIAHSKEAMPFLERNRLPGPNRNAIDANAALVDITSYLYLKEKVFSAYDMAVVITKLDICTRRYVGGPYDSNVAGLAYIGTACTVDHFSKKVKSATIIEDSGGFSGVLYAVHEIGHLLGCVHDGETANSYMRGPGASRCPQKNGFIMNKYVHSDRALQWSKCSVEQFQHFLSSKDASCLFNYPNVNLMRDELPGAMLTLDEQCKRVGRTRACYKDSRVCIHLFCLNQSGKCVSVRPAAEGSSCGNAKVCKGGKCVGGNVPIDYEKGFTNLVHILNRLRSSADRLHRSRNRS